MEIARYLDRPKDALKHVFPNVVLARWRNRPTDELLERLEVLDACGPDPSDYRTAGRVRLLRARKAAWETYLDAAFSCGMFEGKRGVDLLARLRSQDANDFRSAIAECLVCWFFAGRLNLPVRAVATNDLGPSPDLQIVLPQGLASIEVKSPFRERPKTRIWWGDESDKVAQCIHQANKQFAVDGPNIVVLVPKLRRSLIDDRDSLIRAAYGQTRITARFDPTTGVAGPATAEYFPNGKFLNNVLPNGKPLKPDLLPAYRRISAILCVEERPHVIWNNGARRMFVQDCWLKHDVLVLHNPNAHDRISVDVFEEYPQFVEVGNSMEWTDGHDVFV
jgi:hypothetical protein